MFYKKNLISQLIFILSIVYVIIILTKTSILLKTHLKNYINIETITIYLILLIVILDLIIKLIFSQVKTLNIYPYLRLKIQRKKLADFVIVMNHFNVVNVVGLLLLIPITIICVGKISFTNIILVIIILSILLLLNDNISLIYNILKLRLYFLLLFPVFLIVLYHFQKRVINNVLDFSIQIGILEKIFFLCVLFFFSMVTRVLTKRRIIKMLYLN